MKRRYKVTVYETVLEAFDCEIELDVPDDIEQVDLDDALQDAVEERRVNGDDERTFCEISETDFDSEEIVSK